MLKNKKEEKSYHTPHPGTILLIVSLYKKNTEKDQKNFFSTIFLSFTSITYYRHFRNRKNLNMGGDFYVFKMS